MLKSIKRISEIFPHLKSEINPIGFSFLKNVPRPSCHLIVLFSNDSIQGYAQQISSLLLQNGINLFFQNSYQGHVIRSNDLVRIIAESTAHFLLVVGDRNRINISVSARIDGRLLEIGPNDFLNLVQSTWPLQIFEPTGLGFDTQLHAPPGQQRSLRSTMLDELITDEQLAKMPIEDTSILLNNFLPSGSKFLTERIITAKRDFEAMKSTLSRFISPEAFSVSMDEIAAQRPPFWRSAPSAGHAGPPQPHMAPKPPLEGFFNSQGAAPVAKGKKAGGRRRTSQPSSPKTRRAPTPDPQDPESELPPMCVGGHFPTIELVQRLMEINRTNIRDIHILDEAIKGLTILRAPRFFVGPGMSPGELHEVPEEPDGNFKFPPLLNNGVFTPYFVKVFSGIIGIWRTETEMQYEVYTRMLGLVQPIARSLPPEITLPPCALPDDSMRAIVDILSNAAHAETYGDSLLELKRSLEATPESPESASALRALLHFLLELKAITKTELDLQSENAIATAPVSPAALAALAAPAAPAAPTALAAPVVPIAPAAPIMPAAPVAPAAPAAPSRPPRAQAMFSPNMSMPPGFNTSPPNPAQDVSPFSAPFPNMQAFLSRSHKAPPQFLLNRGFHPTGFGPS